jgi:hypothetical protein
MRPQTILSVSILILRSTAFDIMTYTSKRCTGLQAPVTLNVEDGCNTFRAGEAQAFIMKWQSEADNDRLLVTYSDNNCCHADMIEAYGWEDECTAFGGLGVGSWRVIDPNDPDKGKAEEMDNYACRKCGKDDCGLD